MRFLFAVVLFAAASVASSMAADVKFVRVWPGWRDSESFERIAEYFTGKEDTGREVVLRTHPDQRAGFYFLVRVANSGAEISGAKFVLQVILPSIPEPKTLTFPAEIKARSNVFQLGLTGSDWPDKDIHPVAWKLELRSADDTVVTSEQSFLWALPE